jgi:dihydroorotase
MTTLTLIRPDDWHLHLRDGAALAAVLPDTARQMGRAIIMPNLKPPVTTVEAAAAYRERILAALPAGSRFEPLMTLYLTDNTSAEEVRKARASGFVHGIKLYPAGATTNSDFGVSSIDKAMPALEAMADCGMPLLVHGEVTDSAIDIFDREAVFIEQVFQPLLARLPSLRVVFEHITTKDAAEYVASAPDNIAATITAHHLLMNRNAIFVGGIRPHHYCLPVLKRELHRQALVAAATSGSAKFFLGTDSAPHAPCQGSRLWLCRHVHRQCRHRAVCRSLRRRRCAGQAGSLCQPERPGLLRPGPQCRHHHPGEGKLDRAGRTGIRRRCTGAAARWRSHPLAHAGLNPAWPDRTEKAPARELFLWLACWSGNRSRCDIWPMAIPDVHSHLY